MGHRLYTATVMTSGERETVHFDDWHAVAAAAELSFVAWRAALAPILPAGAEIEHVGATSVPGCVTKGDLDILVRVTQASFKAADEALAARLARNLGSVRTEFFAAFADERASPPLGVQLVVRGSALDDFVAFRDLLQSSPPTLAAYNVLKSRHEAASMETYRAAKDEFIERALADLRQHRACSDQQD